MVRVMIAKQTLRAQHLTVRDAIAESTRIEAALAVSDIGAVSLEERAGGAVVAGYHPIRSELDPRPLMAALAAAGARLALPAVISKTEIVFRELSRTGTLEAGAFGTFHPPASAPELQPDILLMPLCVFDGAGNRIGYGAGHYDRAIAKLLAAGATPLLVGLAFEEQRAPSVPVEDHDMPLDMILTPSGLQEFAR